MEFQKLVRDRYSCKKYSDKLLEPEKLQQILEAGQLAPTAANRQEHHVYVLQSEDSLQKTDEVTPCRFGAKTVLLVTTDRTKAFPYPGETGLTAGEENAAIVGTHMMLAASDLGVDNCWINLFDPAKAQEVFGLSETELPVFFLDLGYAAEGAGPLPNHTVRKDLTENVTYR